MNVHHQTSKIGPVDSTVLVEQARRAMPTVLEEIVASGEKSTADTEAKILLSVVKSD